MYVFALSELATGMFLAALALMIVILLRRTYRYLSRQKKDDPTLVHTRRPQQENRAHHLDAPDEVLDWEVQMHETARELSAQLDSKMGALQALIADADRAAGRLEAAAAQAADPLAQPDRPEKLPDDQASEQPARQHSHEEIYTLADYGFDVAEISSRVGSPVGEVERILGLREKK